MRLFRVSAYVGAALLLFGCTSRDDKPNLNQTVEWMRNALSEHNGQRLDEAYAKDVILINKLSSDRCNLTYEASSNESVQYDLSDINPKTIAVKPIGKAVWVTFDARDFHKSVHYRHPSDASLDYDSESGGFSLDSPDIAKSFSQALQRAVELCGGRPSTF
jgi:hypothetical protein